MSAKIAIIYGSVRAKRQGIYFAEYLKKQSDQRGLSATLVDPLEYNLPLLDKMHKEYKEGEAPEALEKLSKIFNEADGFIIVSGEYNHSMPPALSNLMDHFQKEYFFKPAGIASYSAGIFGGVRAAVHLRAFLGELGMPTISSMLPIGKVQSVFDKSGNLIDEKYEKRIMKFLDELEWYVNALKNARTNGTPY